MHCCLFLAALCRMKVHSRVVKDWTIFSPGIILYLQPFIILIKRCFWEHDSHSDRWDVVRETHKLCWMDHMDTAPELLSPWPGAIPGWAKEKWWWKLWTDNIDGDILYARHHYLYIWYASHHLRSIFTASGISSINTCHSHSSLPQHNQRSANKIKMHITVQWREEAVHSLKPVFVVTQKTIRV